MSTWSELNEKLNKIDWSGMVKIEENKEFNAALCNEIAHEAIAARERDFIMSLIRHAAESGCFHTILPRCHPDTINWLKDLGFKIYYQGQTEISWEDSKNV